MNSYPNYEEIVNARLVSHTIADVPELSEFQGGLLGIISYCGRVSNPKNQANVDTADRLIKYLIKHKHWSPFEMADICLEVITTRDIGRQLLRHGFRFQEFSQRYADPTEELGFCLRECRFQDPNNRQSSIPVDYDKESDNHASFDFRYFQIEQINTAISFYKTTLSLGIAKEQARTFLPEGNTISRMYVKGSVRNWIHYLEVRTDMSTQREHRLLAFKAAEAIAPCFPMITDFVRGDI